MTSIERFDAMPEAVQGVIACDVICELAGGRRAAWAEMVGRAIQRWDASVVGLDDDQQQSLALAILSVRPSWNRLTAGVVS